MTFIMAAAVQAQTADKQIDKLIKDPKTKENAAKADVYIAGNPIMTDSMQAATNQPAKKHKKKNRKCNKHS